MKHKKSHWLYPEASLLKEGVTIIEKWRAGLVWGRERGESGRERQRGGQAEKQSQFYPHSNILWALAPKSAPLSRTLFLDRTTIFPDQKIETIIVSSLQVRFTYNIKRLLPWVKLSFPNTPPIIQTLLWAQASHFHFQSLHTLLFCDVGFPSNAVITIDK